MCYSSNTGLMCSGLRRLDRLASFFWGSRDDLRIEEAGEEETQTEEGPPAVGKLAQIASCKIKGEPASCNAWKWQVTRCDPELLNHGRLHAVMSVLNNDPCSVFDLRLPQGRLSSTVLSHCISAVRVYSLQNECFKVGLTSDPSHRWNNSEYGYGKQGRF